MHQFVAVNVGGTEAKQCTKGFQRSIHILAGPIEPLGALFSHLRGFPTFISTMVRVGEGYAFVSIILYQQLPRKNRNQSFIICSKIPANLLGAGRIYHRYLHVPPSPNPPGTWRAMACEYLNAAGMNWRGDFQNTNLMNTIK